MRKFLKLGLLIGGVLALLGGGDVMAAAKSASKKQAAIQFGTNVRTRVEATGVYDQECYDKYYGCMDQFCIVDNELGGSCNCSDDIYQYETALDEISKMLEEAERIKLEEVERVKVGANADIIFGDGIRRYDEKGNVIRSKRKTDTDKKVDDVKKSTDSFWTSLYEEDDEDEEGEIFDKTGKELYKAAHDICKRDVGIECEKDMALLTKIYSRQITSDCKGLANSIDEKRKEAKTQLASANASVRSALKESLDNANKYDRGTCMVEYKKCMQSEDACGPTWENCVFTIAAENMQNEKAKSVKNTKVKTVVKYNITPSTQERLDAKKFVCEKVLDQCMAVRDYVWDDFLKDIAPTIRLAEQKAESNKRQSCLSTISNCIQKACKDDIVGKGEATMDACLARPSMARSFCKVEIEPCERMEPQIWEYVESKLAAMRVDACTQEVKDCLTSDDRCGADYSNCIGMDYEFVFNLCPVEKLVVCNKANSRFNRQDVERIARGLFMNVDNKLLSECENVVEQKMMEVCGSTTDCNALATDESFGTGSLRAQKSTGAKYRITGLISFGNIPVAGLGDTVNNEDLNIEGTPGFDPTKKGVQTVKFGELLVDEYVNTLGSDAPYIANKEAIIESIGSELKNITTSINNTIAVIESDQRVQYCIKGRSKKQITGEDASTEARFPNLMNQYRVMIAMAGLRKAQTNYNKKLEQMIEDASKDASADVAQYLCQKMANIGQGFTGSKEIKQAELTTPNAIYFDVAAGVTDKDLASVGGSSLIGKPESSGTLMERYSVFDRNTRICKVCTTTTTQNCKYDYSSGFSLLTFSIKNNDTTECETNGGDQVCKDFQM